VKAAERAREDPVIRLERDNKRLLNENMRLDTENDNLARELVNSKIEMRKEIDAMEDSKDSYEKELEGCKSLLQEAVDERKRLEGETEQLKQLLKREIDKFDAEIATKNNVIDEYKTICSQLSGKLEKAQKGAAVAPSPASAGSPAHTLAGAGSCGEEPDERIKELELELAKTKLALVETECKNQDLTHQLNIVQDKAETGGPNSQAGNKTWFSGKSLFNSANKTLNSLRENAALATSANTNASSVTMVRSMSVVSGATVAASSSSSTAAKPAPVMSKSNSVDNIRD